MPKEAKEARWTVESDYTGMRQLCDNANYWLYRAWTPQPPLITGTVDEPRSTNRIRR